MFLMFSVIWHACESWTLTGELRQRIYALEMRCHRTIQNISSVDRIKKLHTVRHHQTRSGSVERTNNNHQEEKN